jgi:hypothetical protein
VVATVWRYPAGSPRASRSARRCRNADDEAYALIREALTTSGDITPADGTLTIRLDPLSAPRRTRALAALCEKLTATVTTYPGTTLTLRYEVKEPTA